MCPNLSIHLSVEKIQDIFSTWMPLGMIPLLQLACKFSQSILFSMGLGHLPDKFGSKLELGRELPGYVPYHRFSFLEEEHMYCHFFTFL